jgi:hypothetical protein
MSEVKTVKPPFEGLRIGRDPEVISNPYSGASVLSGLENIFQMNSWYFWIKMFLRGSLVKTPIRDFFFFFLGRGTGLKVHRSFKRPHRITLDFSQGSCKL